MKISQANKNTLKEIRNIFSIFILLILIAEVFDLYYLDELREQPYYYCTIIWCLFVCWGAKFEAYYYYYDCQEESKNPNLHPLLWMTRLMCMIPIWILTDWKAVACYVVIAPFFHDGSYYKQREQIAKGTYPKKWFAQSASSTAWSTKYFTPIVRTALAIIGIAAIIMLRYKFL